MALFGGMSDAEKKQISENMQNLSNQIAALQQQLAAKDSQVKDLQQALASAQEATTATTTADDSAAQKIKELEQKLASAQAERDADAMANEMMLKDAQEQLTKLQSQLAEAPTVSTQVASGLTAGGLAVGGSAWVTRAGGLPLRLRAGAGLGHEVLGALQPGTQMTLLDGPQPNDGHSWWHIRAEDGREGWVAGEELRTQAD